MSVLLCCLASVAAVNDSYVFVTGGSTLFRLDGPVLSLTHTLATDLLVNPGFVAQFGTIIDPGTGARSLDSSVTSIWVCVLHLWKKLCANAKQCRAVLLARKSATAALLLENLTLSILSMLICGHFTAG